MEFNDLVSEGISDEEIKTKIYVNLLKVAAYKAINPTVTSVEMQVIGFQSLIEQNKIIIRQNELILRALQKLSTK